MITSSARLPRPCALSQQLCLLHICNTEPLQYLLFDAAGIHCKQVGLLYQSHLPAALHTPYNSCSYLALPLVVPLLWRLHSCSLVV
jgi:hypothetical protein